MINPVSSDNPTEHLKECDFLETIDNNKKFGFTCDQVDGEFGFINLPHIPKSSDYASFDNREIRILSADRLDEYNETKDVQLNNIFQSSTCGNEGKIGANSTEGQVSFYSVFSDDDCLVQSGRSIDQDGKTWDVKR